MAVNKSELLSVLNRYWACIEALVVTVDDIESMNIGIVVSRTEPEKTNVVWVKPTD